MIAMQGDGVSAGIASGPIRFYRKDAAEVCRRTAEDPAAETARYQAATRTAIEQLGVLAEKARSEAGDDAACLFETHQMMLEDLDYVAAIGDLIAAEHVNADFAVHETGRQFAAMFSAMDDEYMRARSADVLDISTRLERILRGETDGESADRAPAIIAAEDLSPSETVQMDKSRILGFVLSAGHRNSHTAILARTLGIPAVIHLGEDLRPELEGRTAILDGQTGQLVVDPDEATRSYLAEKQAREREARRKLEELRGQSDVTRDGKEVRLYANISSPSILDAVLANDARGIGLFRSEFLYLENSDYPTEEQQFEAYRTVLQRMGGRQVIIRTLDIGADKKVPYFQLPHEENSALGMRAIRICLSRPEVFKTQLRALYRASVYGNLAIMFPMIASVWEIQEIKRICAAVRKELEREKLPYQQDVALGIMIETPASVLIADHLAREVDFFSIGTNDLTQYTLAVDREGAPGLERFSDAHHPAVLRMIKMTIDAAHAAGIWAGICGELASDTSLTELFLAMGADELSVSARSILGVRSVIRSVNTSQNREKLLKVLE
jgi:phosphotransferase system enzyme I (PtsI)